jgi:hypothetical protein
MREQNQINVQPRSSSRFFLPALLCGLGGMILGIALTLFYLQTSGRLSAPAISPDQNQTLGEVAVLPGPKVQMTGDGFFLVERDHAQQLPEITDDGQIPSVNIPTTTQRQPQIGVQGPNYPICNLVLRAYHAGFGVDVNMTPAGAVINKIVPGSPAEQAGLLPGDLILTMDGEKASYTGVYRPGQLDLFGPMVPSVSLEVTRGTATIKKTLPRTYLYPDDPFETQLYNGIEFSIAPQSQYILITPKKPLSPGIYRLEFRPNQQPVVMGFPVYQATPTPTPTAIPVPAGKWLFRVQ